MKHGLLNLAAFGLLFDAFDFLCNPLAELIRFGTQGLIAESLEHCLQRIDLCHGIGGFFNLAFIGVAPEDFDKFLET